MQFPEKLTNQTSENGEKPNFGSDFDPFGLNLGPQIETFSFLKFSGGIEMEHA